MNVQIEIFLQQTLREYANGHFIFEIDVNVAIDVLLRIKKNSELL